MKPGRLTIWKDPDEDGYHATFTVDVHEPSREEVQDSIQRVLAEALERLQEQSVA